MKQIRNIRVISSPKEPDFTTLATLGETLERDWYQNLIVSPIRYLMMASPSHFYFLASHQSPAISHPGSALGLYHAELWRYDVAEFFLGKKNDSSYVEFNLAPNGAWWSCQFESPRKPAEREPRKLSGIETRSEQTAKGWQAMAAIPRQSLPSLEDAQLSVCFILESPDAVFLTTAEPQSGPPDFHRPETFLPLKLEEALDERL